METKSKVLVGIMVTLVLTLPLMDYVLAAGMDNGEPNGGLNLSPRERLAQFRTRLQAQRRRGQACRRFFGAAEAVAIQGTVITYFRDILIIDSEGKRLNIVLPRVWTIDSQIINVSQMAEDYLTTGTAVSIEALQSKVTNNQTVTLTTIQAYEITAGEYHFYAVLPFNIDKSD